MPTEETIMSAAAPKVSFVSLGCPKALVDSERIITRLRAEGYELVREHPGQYLWGYNRYKRPRGAEAPPAASGEIA